MAIQWSGLGPALLLPLDRSRPEPLRVQLETGLREAIRDGRLSIGERLPSSRELARTLGVSRGLVQECFSQLQAEGYLTSQVGSATRVAANAHKSPDGNTEVRRDAATHPPEPRLLADFLPAVPDLASFPRTDWAWAVQQACRDAPNAALGYGDHQGNEVLRSVLAGYLARVRGAAARPERLVVCAGFCQGLNLVLKALADKGVTKVAFEDPGYDETSTLAMAWAGLTDLVRVPVDSQGIDVAALRASGAQAVVLTPAHQWPTGVVLSPERRHALVNWATSTAGWIVEDDYDAEFRYDREPVGVVQGLAPDRVFAVGTVSKSLAPAVRLGWVLCPSTMLEAVADQKNALDRGCPGIDQLALARLMESGRYDRHLRKARAMYGARRMVLLDALSEHAKGMPVTGLAAGFHAVAHLPADFDEIEVRAAARARSVGLYGMSTQRSSRATTPGQLILGFGNVSDRTIRSGIAKISDLLI
ncbi:PLP-dependent aminotransferase family protein [Kribbella capetownensis]|uniref:PLP-dependent aminotransferase family protein n=2 Tax=Kribbella capetownensis TaxID=1572659 RepID=A0A4R0JV93_9ACTN|nr:PLP-dependent aminotransferase family protein [Kribbella capetownensis]